jgi:flagellar protein FlaG
MGSPVVTSSLATQPVPVFSGAGAATPGGPAAVLPTPPVAAAPAAATPAAAAPAPSVPTAPQLQAAIQKVQAAMQPAAGNIEFSLDQSSGKPVVRVVDAETGDVIRQIPSEEMLAIAEAIDKNVSRLFSSEA